LVGVKDTVIIQEVAGERSEEAEEAAERVAADSGDEAAPAGIRRNCNFRKGLVFDSPVAFMEKI
jgi:hypothetical protein